MKYVVRKKYIALFISAIIFFLSCIYFISQYIISCNKSPNILLITIDALRYDHLGCYGYKRNTSPNIDKLANQGVRFTQAIAQACWTHPSNCSFFTSTYPYMHLIDFNSYLNPHCLSLAKILDSNNYSTVFITDHVLWIRRIHGFKEQFKTYIELSENSPLEITKEAVKWLNKNNNKKFFLWVYYLGTHGPYFPSLPYSKKFYNDGMIRKKFIPISPDDTKNLFGVIPQHIAQDNITDVSYYIAQYDGKLRIIDDQIKILLQQLKKLNLEKNTLVILTSDHGESLGEHNFYFRHGFTLYDTTLRVPLIFRYPDIIPSNTIRNYQVRLIDVVSTIMDMLHISNKHYTDIKGKSLMPLILENKKPSDTYVFSEQGIFPMYSIRTENWKLIYIDSQAFKDNSFKNYYKNSYELYNLKNDPLETNNLIKQEQTVFSILKKQLDQYIQKAQQYKLRSDFKGNTETNILSKEDKEKLESLGYVQ